MDPDEFKRTLARWAFDSKTATRFVRYTLQLGTDRKLQRRAASARAGLPRQQLMDDHSSAAEKLSKMESHLSLRLASSSMNPARI